MRKTEHNHLPAFDRKLAHILRHAAVVFSEKGYEGASIRDISRSSGVSLSGLYYYFESKQQLLFLIQLYTFSEIIRLLETRLVGVTDPVARVGTLVRNHLGYFLRHPVEMKVLSHEDEALEGRHSRKVAQLKKRYYSMAMDIFEDLRRAGCVRRLNPRVAVMSLFGMMNWIYTWHNPRMDPSADAIADAMVGIFLEGVSNGHPARTAARAPRRIVDPKTHSRHREGTAFAVPQVPQDRRGFGL